MEEEAKAYLSKLIEECGITSITGRAVSAFAFRYFLLNGRWLIERGLLIFFEVFAIIFLLKGAFGFEVRMVARILSSAGVIALFNVIFNILQVKHLNDIVKMELKFLKRYRDHITFKEDPENGGYEKE